MKPTIRKPHKKCTCPHCGKTFTAPQGLAGHIRYLHPDQPPLGTRGERPLRQAKSASATAPLPAPKTGVRTLLQTKKVTCPHCDKAFARPSSLSTHIRYRHPGKSQAATALPPTTPPKASAPAPAPVVAPKASVEEHLKTAMIY